MAFDSDVRSTAVAWNNDLYVGGIFETAGVCDSAYFARWNDQVDFAPPSRMRINRPQMQPGDAFTFQATATEKASYVIEVTQDFTTWTTLLTNGAPAVEVTNNVPGADRRFYRMRQVP